MVSVCFFQISYISVVKYLFLHYCSLQISGTDSGNQASTLDRDTNLKCILNFLKNAMKLRIFGMGAPPLKRLLDLVKTGEGTPSSVSQIH